jgi:hypothetical protein
MYGLGGVAAASFAAGWSREARRQAAFNAATARSVVAANRAVADVERAECADLRSQLVEARAEACRLQVHVDALTLVLTGERAPLRRPEPTTEVREGDLRTALIYARAEVRGLLAEIDDLGEELQEAA